MKSIKLRYIRKVARSGDWNRTGKVQGRSSDLESMATGECRIYVHKALANKNYLVDKLLPTLQEGLYHVYQECSPLTILLRIKVSQKNVPPQYFFLEQIVIVCFLCSWHACSCLLFILSLRMENRTLSHIYERLYLSMFLLRVVLLALM